MFVLGTAGHVDHGKSTLLKALSGMEPDRLPEEKNRGMTIDLNFVWFDVESFGTVGIVDVPGHKRFVKNMVTGAAAIDAFLFVVAADDGWMPQSEEHLQVLRLLDIQRGIAVITKCDLVSVDRVDEVLFDIERRFREILGSKIATYKTADGMSGIKEGVMKLLSQLPPPRQKADARLWVDRVFTPKGLGVVVTGTLVEGGVTTGSKLFVAGAEQAAEVKSIQAYQRVVSSLRPNSRAAFQLSHVRASELKRGLLLTTNHQESLTQTIDAKLEVLGRGFGRNSRVSLHWGTCKESALLIPFSKGENTLFGRLKFQHPVPIRMGERFLVRTAGEEKTIGGGVCIDCSPVARYALAKTTLAQWSPGLAGQLRYVMVRNGILDFEDFSRRSVFLDRDTKSLVSSYISPVDGLYITSQKLAHWNKQFETDRGKEIPLEKMAQWLSVQLSDEKLHRLINWFVIEKRLTKVSKVCRIGGEVQKQVDFGKAKRLFQEAAGAPLEAAKLNSIPRTELSEWINQGLIVRLSDGLFLEGSVYRKHLEIVAQFLRAKGQATTSELKEALGLSRKVAVFVLEKMDHDRVTYLKDGVRRLLKG